MIQLSNTFSKRKSISIKFQEESEVCYCIPSGIPLNSSCGKNLRQYSPMEAWLTMALNALAYNKFEWPKYFSHNSPLEYKSLMGCRLSSKSSRNSLPFVSEAWNIIFQLLRILLHLFFLSNSYKNLHGKIGTRSNFFVSLLTIW